MNKPRKCPHCQNENIYIQYGYDSKKKKWYRCKCNNCNIANKYWHDTKKEAIEFWNDGVIHDC